MRQGKQKQKSSKEERIRLLSDWIDEITVLSLLDEVAGICSQRMWDGFARDLRRLARHACIQDDSRR